MKRPESLVAVHTYTHTGNLINKKINNKQGKIVSIFEK